MVTQTALMNVLFHLVVISSFISQGKLYLKPTNITIRIALYIETNLEFDASSSIYSISIHIASTYMYKMAISRIAIL